MLVQVQTSMATIDFRKMVLAGHLNAEMIIVSVHDNCYSTYCKDR